MENTTNNQQSTSLSTNQTRQIPARTKPSGALPKSDQVETISPPRNLLCSSSKQHSNDTNKGKEIVEEPRERLKRHREEVAGRVIPDKWSQENLLREKEEPRERLQRHREEVAGRVTIPDKWSQENLLRDWMDYSSFDNLLAPKGLASAREALMAQGRSRTSSQRFRIESMC